MGKTLDKIISKGLILATGLTMGLSSARSEVYTVPLDLPTGARTLNMVRIPAGTYLMGNTGTARDMTAEDGTYSNSFPRHEVTISNDFYIGETEITQAQYLSVIGNNPSNDYGVGDNYPVYYVSWDNVQNFITSLNSLNQGTFRLPSESEWEYACRGSESNPERYNIFSFGDDLSVNLEGCEFSNLFDDYMVWGGDWGGGVECGNNPGQAEEVASRLPNDYGLYDMHGNVWEWCQDIWHNNYEGAPIDGSAWEENPVEDFRVIRSGTWGSPARFSRSAMRGWNRPYQVSRSIGFRLTIDAEEIDTQTPTPTFTDTFSITNTPTNTLTLTQTETSTPFPTNTPYDTNTPYPTYTPRPTYTPNPRADLKINRMRLTTEFDDCSSRNIGLEVEIQNAGNLYAGPFSVKINDDFKMHNNLLPAGATDTIWSGSYEFGLNITFLDIYNEVLESNESNNTFFENFYVTPTPMSTCTPTETSTPFPTNTPYPTYTFYPTSTPYDTNTPYPTYTFYPTYTEIPTPIPTETFTVTPTYDETNTPTFSATYTPSETATETNTIRPTPTNTQIWNNADIDGNGVVDSNDILFLLQEWHKHEKEPVFSEQ